MSKEKLYNELETQMLEYSDMAAVIVLPNGGTSSVLIKNGLHTIDERIRCMSRSNFQLTPVVRYN